MDYTLFEAFIRYSTLGVDFSGFTYPEKFLTLSTRVGIDDHFRALCHVNYVSDPDEWYVLLRVPSTWRVLVPVPQDQCDEYLLSDEKKNEIFDGLMGDWQAVTTHHRTIYRVHQRVATKFNHGRIVLVGDAAHLNNPLGGFGMNGGIHDAWNLVQKLVRILQDGDNPTELLDHYDRQRRTIMNNFVQAQTIRNKRMIEERNERSKQLEWEEMRSIHKDSKLRRDFMLRQSMVQSLQRMLNWRHSGFSVHNRVHTKADDAEGRQRLARYMIRCPFALEKMRYAPDSGMVIYRSKPHATLKRNYQLMSALKWLRLLMNHIPDRYEHLVRYYGYYSNRSRGARRLIENGDDTAGPIRIDESPATTCRKAAWARLIQKVYQVDPLECVNCGSNMCIIALIDDVDVVERILRHLNQWHPQPDTFTPAGPDPPLPQGETLPLTYHPVPDIA